MRCLALALALSVPAVAAQSAAEYRVTFESTWSQDTHPLDWPGASAHYSQLIAVVHASQGAIWSPGAVATPGVEQMAETGGTSLLVAEAEAMGGEVHSAAVGPAMSLSPGTVSMTVTVDEEHPRVSLLTMIAPSPDWFVGADGIDLLDTEGWTPGRSLTLFAWDAGTDSGTQYTSQNEDTQPREPIALSEAPPFVSAGPLGTFTFELLLVIDSDDAPRSFTLGPVAPNPVRGDASLSVTMASAGAVQIQLLDPLGRTVAGREVALGAGAQRLSLPTRGLAAGSYVARIVTADGVATRRFVIAR